MGIQKKSMWLQWTSILCDKFTHEVSKIHNIAHHSVQVIHTQQSQLHIKMSSNHNAAFVSVWIVAIQCTQPLFYAFSDLHQFLICPLIFGLMSFGWLHTITLNPYFWGKYHLWFMSTSSEMQLGHKTRAGCNHNNAFVSVSTVSIQCLAWH